jgi:K+-sensing histidine kinase KdpD
LTLPLSVTLRDIINVLAHDVKNPLSSMITNTQFLRDEAASDDARAAAEDVLAAAAWISRMLSNLSDIARFADPANKDDLSGDADLGALLRQAEKTMIVHARDRDLQIEIAESAASRVPYDPELLLRVLETTIEACIRHASKGSSVVVSCTPGTVSFRCTGTPLDAKERALLFTEEAFIGENSKRLRLAPTFGLAFCRRAARAMGGDMVADETSSGLLLRWLLGPGATSS